MTVDMTQYCRNTTDYIVHVKSSKLSTNTTYCKKAFYMVYNRKIGIDKCNYCTFTIFLHRVRVRLFYSSLYRFVRDSFYNNLDGKQWRKSLSIDLHHLSMNCVKRPNLQSRQSIDCNCIVDIILLVNKLTY